MHWWVTQECREGPGRSEGGSGSEVEVEVGDGCEIGRVVENDGEAAAEAGGGGEKSRRGHQTDVPYSGAKAATWSSMRGTSGTLDSRIVGQIASGSGRAVCDATNLVWTWVGGVWTGLTGPGVCLAVSGRPVAWSRPGVTGQKGPRLTV